MYVTMTYRNLISLLLSIQLFLCMYICMYIYIYIYVCNNDSPYPDQPASQHTAV